MTMYKPAPQRPKKTNIVRSRNGCQSCRERRTKCDEQKPICGTCARLGKACQTYQREFKFRTVITKPAKSLKPAGDSRDSEEIKKTIERISTSERSPSDPSSVGNIDLIKSLQHSEQDILYSTIWEDYCLPAMHPMFKVLSSSYAGDKMLKDAMLALSSCTLSPLHPERKISTNSNMGLFSPSLVQQTRSQLYYSSAIHKLATLREDDCRENLTAVLTVLTIFAYIESSMGNFKGFYCHDEGMTNLLLHFNTNPHDPTIDCLITAWMQVRIVVWWARAYFCSMEILRSLPSVSPPIILEQAFPSPQRKKVTVLSIMCESHRLNFQTLMAHWQLWSPESEATQQSSGNDEDYESACLLLQEQAQALDKWIGKLPPSELPIENHDTLERVYTSDSEDDPLYLKSHESALNFAYYVIGRIMQCTGLLRSLQMKRDSYTKYEFHEDEEWCRLLLRIVRGTNMQTSFRMNNYTIGFSGLLLTALLRCKSQTLGLAIENWLQNLGDLKPTEEGGFPLYQTLGVVKSINRQKAMGRDVLGLTQPVDDSGGTPKFSAYNSQPISILMFHGISRISGDLFTECVSIGA